MEEAQIIVDVEASMQHELDKLWGNTNEAKKFTIFRTPHNIFQSKKNLFEPSVISIGPFHYGQKHLRAMEEQKWRFLRDFLSRKDHISLNLCITEMKSLEERTRRCYSEKFDDLQSKAFVEMMLLDGCFLLEYFLKSIEGNWDSINEVGWNSQLNTNDFLLLENQIPFFIVEKLMELIGFNQENKMIFAKYLAYSLLPQEYHEYILTAPPAETPEIIDSIIADPPAEIPDSTHSTDSDPPAEILDRLAEILDRPAEIPDSTHSTDSDPPAETPETIDSIIADPPAEIPDSTHSTDSDPPAEILDRLAEILDRPAEILDPPDEIHHLTHLCYHYLVPNLGIPVVLSSKPFDLTRMFSTNRIKCLLNRFRSRVLRGKSPHSTSRSSSVPNSTMNISSMVVRSATELKQKGLKFTQQSNPRHMLDISFKYGVLKIPRLTITDYTKPLFANLLAFEHSNYGNEYSPFGRFLSFLDKLINTTNDVTILQECEIFENWLGSEEELAHFLNHVTEGNALSSDHYLVEVYTEVHKYTESRWHRHQAKLIRDYFSSPWAIISLIAAFILLVLTLVQSFFAVFAYFVPPSS